MQPTITAEYLASQGLSENFPQRFWAKVNKDGPIPPKQPELGPCWVWTAGKVSQGYGAIAVTRRKQAPAHRAAWLLTNGAIPEGLWVLHKCDNPACVRPEHLFLGTSTDNARDRSAKGRNGWPLACEKHHKAKYSVEQILEIRRLSADGISQAEIARSLKVHAQTVWCVIHNRRWATLSKSS